MYPNQAMPVFAVNVTAASCTTGTCGPSAASAPVGRAFPHSAWLLWIAFLGVLASLAGCGGGAVNRGQGPTTTPQIQVAMTQMPPATITPGGTATVAATVTNDAANAGVDWVLDCASCGSLSAGHTASGAPTTYTAAPYYVGGNVTLHARATSDPAAEAVATFNTPGNLKVIFAPGYAPPATMDPLQYVDLQAGISGAPSTINYSYSLSCSSTWTNGCGRLNPSGLVSNFQDVYYTAPPLPVSGGITITVSAIVPGAPTTTTSQKVTINSMPVPPVSVAVESDLSTIPVGNSVLVIPEISNDLTNAGADWSVTCGATGAGACGTFSSAHTANDTQTLDGQYGYLIPNAAVAYIAPATVPPGGKVTVTVASTAVPSATASKDLTIIPANSTGLNGLLEGHWVYLVTGRDQNYDTTTPNAGGFYAVAGTFVGDGRGTILSDEADIMDFKLGFPAMSMGGGSYSLKPDGRGTISLRSGDLNFGFYPNLMTLSVVFIDADHAYLSESDGWGSGTGMLYRQNVNDVAAALSPAGLPLNGTYTLTLNGADQDNPGNRFHLAGALSAAPTTSGTGQSIETSFVGDVTFNGTVFSNVKAATQPAIGGTYNLYGRVTLGSLDLGAQAFHFGNTTVEPLAAYMIDRNHYVVIQDVDKQVIAGGYLVAQPSSPAALSGSFAFAGNGTSGAGVEQAVGGVFTCGGSGSMDSAPAGGSVQAKQSITAACTAPSQGRGLIKFSGSSNGVSQLAAYPTVDMGWQLVEIDGGGPYQAGVALPQQTSAIAASALQGDYAAVLADANAKELQGVVGHLKSDGVSALSGLTDVDLFLYSASSSLSTPSLDVPLSGSYNADASGRFGASLNLAAATAQQLTGQAYVADSEHMLLLAGDSQSTGTGALRLQHLPLFMISPAMLVGQVGVAFNSGTALRGTGGAPPYSFKIVSGSLPAGLGLSSTTGAISGTPTQDGAYAVTIQIADAAGSLGTADLTLAIEAAGGIQVAFVSPLPPTVMGINQTAGLTATLVGDFTGQGIDWAASCSSGSCGALQAPGQTPEFTVHGNSGDLITYHPNYGNLSQGDVVTITATSTEDPTRSASAQIQMQRAQVGISLKGAGGAVLPAYVLFNGTLGLTETVTNDPLTAGADWTLSCGATGGCGSLSTSHTVDGQVVTYTAPAVAPASGAVTITTRSTIDPSASASKKFYISGTVPVMTFLEGNAVILLQGRDANGGAYVLAGTVVGDGGGNITDYELAMTDPSYGYGTIVNPINVAPSTYTLDSSGRGKIVLNLPAWLLGVPGFGASSTVTLSVTYVSPTHALIAEDDSFGSGTGTLDLQNPNDLTAFQNYSAGLNGTYSLMGRGAQLTPNAPIFVGGAMTFSFDSGNVTQTYAVEDKVMNGTVTANSTADSSLPMTVYLNNDQYGSIFGYYSPLYLGADQWILTSFMIDAKHFVTVANSVDGNSYFGGYMVAQPTAPDFSGSYAFTESGTTAMPAAQPQAAGGLFSCGTGGVLDYVSAVSLTKQPTTVSCTTPVQGRGTVTITGSGGSGLSQFAAYPTVDASYLLVGLDGGSDGTAGPVGTGAAHSQTQPAAALSGNYGIGYLATSTSGSYTVNGQAVASGNALTGTVDVSSFNATAQPPVATLSANASIAGTLNADANGRLTAPITGIAESPVEGVLYILNSNDVLFLEADPSTPGTGVLQSQQW